MAADRRSVSAHKAAPKKQINPAPSNPMLQSNTYALYPYLNHTLAIVPMHSSMARPWHSYEPNAWLKK